MKKIKFKLLGFIIAVAFLALGLIGFVNMSNKQYASAAEGEDVITFMSFPDTQEYIDLYSQLHTTMQDELIAKGR